MIIVFWFIFVFDIDLFFIFLVFNLEVCIELDYCEIKEFKDFCVVINDYDVDFFFFELFFDVRFY